MLERLNPEKEKRKQIIALEGEDLYSEIKGGSIVLKKYSSDEFANINFYTLLEAETKKNISSIYIFYFFEF